MVLRLGIKMSREERRNDFRVVRRVLPKNDGGECIQ